MFLCRAERIELIFQSLRSESLSAEVVVDLCHGVLADS